MIIKSFIVKYKSLYLYPEPKTMKPYHTQPKKTRLHAAAAGCTIQR